MRVAIADDAVLFRAGVASLLTDAGMTVTASVGSADELLSAVGRDWSATCTTARSSGW